PSTTACRSSAPTTTCARVRRSTRSRSPSCSWPSGRQVEPGVGELSCPYGRPPGHGAGVPYAPSPSVHAGNRPRVDPVAATPFDLVMVLRFGEEGQSDDGQQRDEEAQRRQPFQACGDAVTEEEQADDGGRDGGRRVHARDRSRGRSPLHREAQEELPDDGVGDKKV